MIQTSDKEKSKDILSVWKSMNDSYTRKLIFKIGIEGGFFSEYNNMTLAMLYCLKHKIRFVLDSSVCNFHPKGWDGFFLPFCDTEIDPAVHFRSCNWRFALKLTQRERTFRHMRNIWPYLTFWKQGLKTQDIFGRSRERRLKNRHYYFPELGIDGNLQQACSRLIAMTWKYTPETASIVNSYIQSLDLPQNYVGMHIRGGDKFVEHKLESIDKYFNCVKASIETRNVYVLTDDYNVIRAICAQYPQWSVWTLCQESESGYFHQEFIKQGKAFQQDQLMKLFASVDILSGSEQFIGTYTSNPGMYIGMRNPEICTGVDFDEWLIW